MATELKEFVKSRLAPYKCPRWIEFLDALPKTATGKIRRNVLRLEANAAREPMAVRLATNPPPSAHELPDPRHSRKQFDQICVDGKQLETLRYFTADTVATSPTIVMLHEGLGSIAMWKDFPEQLAHATHCAVLLYSRYGHGKSERLAEKRTPEFMHHEANVVLPELLAHFQIERPILFGHSDGASIALIHASTWREKSRGLILEAPHLFVEELSLRSIRAIRELYVSAELRAKLARYHDFPEETFFGWNDIWLDPSFRGWNIEACLASITCPVLVIQGENDEYGTLAQVAAITNRLPGAETLILPKCGHWPHRDHCAATLSAVSHFIAKL